MSDATKKQGNKEQASEISVTGEKLDLRKKMGTITMVTPPSFFQNQNKSFCLINLSKKDKDNFADQINKYFPKEDLPYTSGMTTTSQHWIHSATTILNMRNI